MNTSTYDKSIIALLVVDLDLQLKRHGIHQLIGDDNGSPH